MSTAELQPPGRASGELSVVPTETGLAVSGEVDLTSWAVLCDALSRLVSTSAPARDVIIDLSELSFIDGHSVALIAQTARRLGPSRRLLLRRAPAVLLRIAQILCLDREPGLVIEVRGDDGRP